MKLLTAKAHLHNNDSLSSDAFLIVIGRFHLNDMSSQL